MSTISLYCPHCSAELEADQSLIGQTVSCPSCGENFTAKDSPHHMHKLKVKSSDSLESNDSRETPERTLFSGKPSAMYYFFDIVIGIILIPVAIGIIVLLATIIRINTTHYIVTTDRVIVKTGWLNQKQVEIWIRDMRSVGLQRSLWQRIIGTGSVAIGTAASAGIEIQMHGLANPQDIINMINRQRR